MSPRPYHHGSLRDALVLHATRRVEASPGVELALRDIAADAGVSHAAAYRHFPNKSALLAEVAREGFGRFARTLALADAARGADRAKLIALGVAYVAFAHDAEGIFRLMWSPAIKPFDAHPGLAEAANDALAILVGRVTAGQRSGAFRRGPPERLAMAIWSMLHGHALLALDRQLRGPFGVDDVARSTRDVVGLLIDGICAPSARKAV